MQVFNEEAYQHFVNELNSGESIVQFMEEKGADTSGSNKNFYKCPFHRDKTPSLSINDKKGMFKCFSCGRGGRYYDFVYLYYKEILGYHKDKRNFANFLIKTNKKLSTKYNISSLEEKVKFSTKTIEYMFEVEKLRKQELKEITNNTEKDSKLKLEDELSKLTEVDEIVKFLASIQRGEKTWQKK